MKIWFLALLFSTALLLTSCDNFNFNFFNSKDDITEKDTASTFYSPTPDTKPAEQPAAAPDQTVINVEPTLVRPQLFLMMKDWANEPNELKKKQSVLFNNLSFLLVKNNLIPVGAPAAWHSQQPNILIVESGIPLKSKLTNSEPGTYYKQTKRCKAVVAHFFGKRSLLPRAYEAINQWLKENNQKAIGTPWEVYMSDPKIVKDNDFLQTDIYTEAK